MNDKLVNKAYSVKINGEFDKQFTSLREARNYVKHFSQLNNGELPESAEIIKITTTEVVLDNYSNQQVNALVSIK